MALKWIASFSVSLGSDCVKTQQLWFTRLMPDHVGSVIMRSLVQSKVSLEMLVGSRQLRITGDEKDQLSGLAHRIINEITFNADERENIYQTRGLDHIPSSIGLAKRL